MTINPDDWDDVVPAPDSEPEANPDEADDSAPRSSVATKLVRIANEKWRFIEVDGTALAVPKVGGVPRQLRGGQSLRKDLASAYFQRNQRAASQQALTDALATIDGLAAQNPVPGALATRVAKLNEAIYLDMGDDSGRVVKITASGWHIEPHAPDGVWFRRSEVTRALPEPADLGHSLDGLWDHLNVTEQDRPIVLAVLVASLFPDYAHPILHLIGEQGTGKTMFAKCIAGLLDPQAAQVRSAPRDVQGWHTAAHGSWWVTLDNLSGVPPWLSDALCRAVTGDGSVSRALYTDGDLYVIEIRRCIVLTGIDMGAVRGDLAERLATIELDVIPPTKRRRESELTARWEQAHPHVLAAILDMAAKVLARLPGITLDELPRLADFAVILAAVDRVNDTNGLERWQGKAAAAVGDQLAAEPFIARMQEVLVSTFIGTTQQLHTLVTGEHKERDWPKPRAVAGILKRHSPALRTAGWHVERVGNNPHGATLWQLTPPDKAAGSSDTSDSATNPPQSKLSETSEPPQLSEVPRPCDEVPTPDPWGNTGKSEVSELPATFSHGPTLGSCVKCGTTNQRYGDDGQPLCPQCREAAAS